MLNVKLKLLNRPIQLLCVMTYQHNFSTSRLTSSCTAEILLLQEETGSLPIHTGTQLERYSHHLLRKKTEYFVKI